jgi:hypothetical protein
MNKNVNVKLSPCLSRGTVGRPKVTATNNSPLKGSAKNLGEKLSELLTAKAKLAELQAQKQRELEKFERLDAEGGSTLASSKKLRAISDLIETLERRIAELENEAVPRMEADLRILFGIAVEHYCNELAPRIDARERALVEQLQGEFEDRTRCEGWVSRMPSVSYLRAHSVAVYNLANDTGDLLATSTWLLARISDLLAGKLPWPKPEPVNAHVATEAQAA